MSRFLASVTYVFILLLLAACDRIDDGLVAWWRFDEGSGFRVKDASGNGNNGTVHNGGWGEGRIGGALEMDGRNNSIVIVPLSDSLRSTAAGISITAWAYRTAEHNVNILGHGYPSIFLGFHGPQFKWQVLNTRGEVADCYAEIKYRAVLNKWFHLAGTYDGEKVRLYVDGVEICQRPLSGDIVMPEQPFTISGYIASNGSIMDEISGRIDELRVYNRAIADREIRQIYKQAMN